MKPVIETHDLCKSYNGRTVVDHLNLTVPQGCVYGFLGPNGAGKSTSMKMLLGLVHPTGGSVELLGHTMNETNRIPLLRQTGSLIESPSGYLHLTARENLAIVADLKGRCPQGHQPGAGDRPPRLPMPTGRWGSIPSA